MGYGDLQIYDIIIFAGIAVFLVFRLKKVLGKRTGYENNKQNVDMPSLKKNKENTTQKNIPELSENIAKLKAAYEAFDNFDHKKFIQKSIIK